MVISNYLYVLYIIFLCMGSDLVGTTNLVLVVEWRSFLWSNQFGEYSL